MKTPIIKVAVVDNHKLFRSGLIPIIDNFEGMKVIIDADGGEILLKKMKETVPHVILLDIKMPVMSGMDVARILRKKYPKVKIIMLTMYEHPSMITSVYKIGVHGYILKSTDPEEVEKAIHSVMDTGFYFSPTTSMAFLRNLVKDSSIDFNFKNDVFFEDHELLVISYICEELTSKEIAEKFCSLHKMPVDVRTIDRYKSEIIEKLGVKNSLGIVVYALRSGIVE
jgi:DNA-binding NarL/FixJ family response regulator